MGWHRTRSLIVDQSPDTVETCGLWTRGGLEGLEVHFEDKVIHIPRDAILELVAHEYMQKRIAHYESMTTEDIVTEMMDVN